MIDRRSALKIGATTVAGALVRVSAFGKSTSRPAYERAVFDQRFEPCRVFGAELASAGVPTSAIRGDVAKLWYEDLRPALCKERAPIAGLTDRTALFCLEELARDVGMRVVFRVDHTIELGGLAQHVAPAQSRVVAATGRLLKEPEFGRAIADLLSRFDTRGPRDAAAQKRTGPFSPENKLALVSWVIA